MAQKCLMHFCGISSLRMNRHHELERLIGQQAELIEQIKGSPDDLDLHIRFTYLSQQIIAIEDSFSLAAVLFSRRC